MKVEINNIRMGHAPNTAVCLQGESFRFDEALMFCLEDDVIKQIQKSDGQLPDELGEKVAKDGCPQFENGKCKLLNMADCTR